MSNIINIIKDQEVFSRRTFGEGMRTKGLIAHIKQELEEIEKNPTDLMEWVDVIILAIDGAWRAGHNPYEILQTILKKQKINREREWEDVEEDKPVNHKRKN